MTVAPQSEHVSTTADVPKPPSVTLTIDGTTIQVPKGTLVIRAAEQLGIAIPRFCDHPLLDPVGACRQCIVEVEGQRKPLTACTTVVTEGMVVKTQLTSDVAKKAQAGTMELLLINHPLDCPVCDKGGECPLQNQAMSAGRPESRFRDVKRTYPKPLPISEQILLDRERCVLCARCTRFSEQIAGDPFIDLFERGAAEQVSVYRGDREIDLLGGSSNGALPGSDLSDPFHSYFSGNTIQICPVGALTSASYRFRARPFDLVSTPTVCEHCSSGCAQRTDWRRGKVLRRLAGEDAEVNEEWNCDKGRFAFAYPATAGRIAAPLLRGSSGELEPVSWSRALAAAADGLASAIDGAGVGVLTGGRLTVEDAYAYSRFARVVLRSNDIDFRSRPHSHEEAGFLAAHVAGVTPQTGGLTYRDLDTASTVLLAGLEPEEESPIVFLRLRKAVRRLEDAGTHVYSIAPWATHGLEKLSGALVEAAPGAEARVLDALTAGDQRLAELSAGLRKPGAAILVGERLAVVPGALSAVSRLARETGARLAWVPRRAGDRGAVDAGAMPGLLPGGSSVYDAAARAELERLWGCEAGTIPQSAGRDTAGILRAAADGELSGLLVGGVDLDDLANPAAAREALRRVGFVVSLELRHSSVTEYADVVLPVAAATEKAGIYYDWEGRERPFAAALIEAGTLRDAQVLDAVAAELDVSLGAADLVTLRESFATAVGFAGLARPDSVFPRVVGHTRNPDPGEAILATWHHLLDSGALQVGEPHLAGTAPRPVARLSPQTAAELGLSTTQLLVVSNSNGAITLPWVATDMPPRVVWLPTNSPGSAVRRDLAADSGAIVRIAAAEGGE